MFKSILVSLDGSETGEQALRPAVSIARSFGAPLHLARVAVAGITGSLDVEYGKVDHTYMTGVGERLSGAGVSAVKVAVLPVGDIATELEKHRATVGADLTVMCSHGRGPVERAWLGSVSDRFVRLTDAPVLVVRAAKGAGPTESFTSEVPFRRVLVPLDGSQLAEAALGTATELGGKDGTTYILVRVVEPGQTMGAGLQPSLPMTTEKGIEAAIQNAEAELESAADALRDRGFTVETFTTVRQPVARAILEAAEAHAADVIVMATHGRSGISRAWVGSVADKVVRGTDHPVLIVRPRAA